MGRLRILALSVLASGLLTACAGGPASDELVGPPAALAVAQVRARTILPAAFSHGLAPEAVTMVSVPAGIVLVSAISRPRAEVRSGPGGQYELSDVVLERGTEVIVVGRYGVWRKVLVPGAWQSGWVHNQSLGALALNTAPVQIDVRHLPTVLVTREVASVHGFAPADAPPVAPLAVAIPKGALFRLLRRDAKRTLVWLPSTSSVLWLSRKDVQ